MKRWMLPTLAAACLISLLTAAADRPERVKYEHLVIQVPLREAVQLEFHGNGKLDVKIKRLTILDSLGKEGWALITATPQGKSSINCFFRRPIK